MTEPLLHFSMAPVWKQLRHVRVQIADALAAYSTEVRAAAVMTASELLENAIKYGQSVPRAPRISFSLSVVDGCLQIQTVSGSTNVEALERMRAHVEQLRNADDRFSLWLQRVQAHPGNAANGSGLGLYRIMMEGGFELQCSHDDCVVTITATRRIA